MFGDRLFVDIIKTLKNNKRVRKTLFDKDVEMLNEHYGKIDDHRKMSPKKFQAFQRKLKGNEFRRQKHVALVFGSIMIIIVGIVVYYLFFHQS